MSNFKTKKKFMSTLRGNNVVEIKYNSVRICENDIYTILIDVVNKLEDLERRGITKPCKEVKKDIV